MRMLRHFRKDQRGVALIEFVFMTPVLLTLLIGAVEVTRYVMIQQKVQKASYVMDDIVTRFTPATDDNANQGAEINAERLIEVLNNYHTALAPFGNSPDERVVIVTSIQQEGTSTNIKWMRSGGGNLNVNSVVNNIPSAQCQNNCNVDGTPAVLTAPFDISWMAGYDGHNTIVAETYYSYRPLMSGLLETLNINIPPQVMRSVTFMYPRNGDLTYLPCASGDAICSTTITCEVPATLGGGMLNVGESVTAYMGVTVSCGNSCISQERICQVDGTLSGSYIQPSCSVEACTTEVTCTIPDSLGGGTLRVGETILAYAADSVNCDEVCAVELRSCQSDGTLSGSFTYPVCNAPRFCEEVRNCATPGDADCPCETVDFGDCSNGGVYAVEIAKGFAGLESAGCVRLPGGWDYCNQTSTYVGGQFTYCCPR